uniref:Uncharacterized protein n=1 Tax=Plectus sambesii TaxID=2011161 RepID=A0A914USW8_9BILA
MAKLVSIVSGFNDGDADDDDDDEEQGDDSKRDGSHGSGEGVYSSDLNAVTS